MMLAYVAHFRDVATTATPHSMHASILDNAGNEKAHHPFCQARHRHAVRHAPAIHTPCVDEQTMGRRGVVCGVFCNRAFSVTAATSEKQVWCVLSVTFIILTCSSDVEDQSALYRYAEQTIA